jgi:hypothetical protein
MAATMTRSTHQLKDKTMKRSTLALLALGTALTGCTPLNITTPPALPAAPPSLSDAVASFTAAWDRHDMPAVRNGYTDVCNEHLSDIELAIWMDEMPYGDLPITIEQDATDEAWIEIGAPDDPTAGWGEPWFRDDSNRWLSAAC